MGNCVVTVHWSPHSKNKEIKEKMREISKIYNVNTNVHPNIAHYKPNYSSFSAEIVGFSILLKGGNEACMEILDQLSDDWKKILEFFNATEIEIHKQELPI